MELSGLLRPRVCGIFMIQSGVGQQIYQRLPCTVLLSAAPERACVERFALYLTVGFASNY